MPIDKHVDPRFAESIELFNREKYFESHEVMESLWLSTPKDNVYRDLYKGVIQVAAAILLRRKGTHRAAKRLALSAFAYLQRYRDNAFELMVQPLIEDLDLWIQSDLDPQTTIRIQRLT